MSATLDTNNVSGSWKKRQIEDTDSLALEHKELKKPRLYYFRLASESSRCSDDDTESICSIQERSTDVVRDTSDTDSKAGDLTEYEVEIEYEVASSDGDGNGANSTVSTTDSEGMVISAAAFILDSSLEAWVTDVEDSDGNSTSEETSFGRTDFWTCVQCNGRNDNPLYRYCEKCFQARKRFFPPRPRRTKRSRNKKEQDKKGKEKNPVKLDLLRNCLSGLSQDSGIGSSQECPHLDLDQIVVPDTSYNKSGMSTSKEDIDGGQNSPVNNVAPSKRKRKNSENLFDHCDDIKRTSTPDLASKILDSGKTYLNLDHLKTRRKRTFSESSLSDFDEVKKPRLSSRNSDGDPGSSSQNPVENSSQLFSQNSTGSVEVSSQNSTASVEPSSQGSSSSQIESELCLFCNSAPKDSIFLHTNVAHRCCCYKCAKKTLKTTKRCPICNRSVNKVLKIFTS